MCVCVCACACACGVCVCVCVYVLYSSVCPLLVQSYTIHCIWWGFQSPNPQEIQCLKWKCCVRFARLFSWTCPCRKTRPACVYHFELPFKQLDVIHKFCQWMLHISNWIGARRNEGNLDFTAITNETKVLEHASCCQGNEQIMKVESASGTHSGRQRRRQVGHDCSVQCRIEVREYFKHLLWISWIGRILRSCFLWLECQNYNFEINWSKDEEEGLYKCPSHVFMEWG